MNQTYITTTLDTREATGDNPDVTAVVWGVAVPYATEIDLGGLRESFAPQSFDADAAVGVPLCWRHNEPIGVITRAENTADGLMVEAQLANTTLGRDAAALVRTGSVQGLSVGFTPIEDAWNKTRDHVTRLRAALSELSLTHMPAYPTAAVAKIREETPLMSDDTVKEAPEAVPTDTTRAALTEMRGELEAVRDHVASLRVTERPTAAMSPREFMRNYAEKILTRAWTDITLDGTASDQSPIPTEVSARIDFGRPTFAAIGASPLSPGGMDANWLMDDVDPTMGIQSAEKTEIASGPASGKIVSAPVVTFAGGNDISLQWLERAVGWDRADYVARMAEQYARYTNGAVIGELQVLSTNTGTIPTSLDTGALGSTLGAAAAGIVSATGWAPNLVVCDSSTFFRFGAVAGNGYPVAGGNVGNATLASLEFNAFGLRFICDPQMDSGAANAYMLNTRAVGVKESPGAPFTITANVPAKLGVDYAVYGYVAVKGLHPKGITALTNA